MDEGATCAGSAGAGDGCCCKFIPKKYNKLHVVQIITKIKLMYILFMQDVQEIRKKILFWSLVDKIILI
jgi:hypothetical protein